MRLRSDDERGEEVLRSMTCSAELGQGDASFVKGGDRLECFAERNPRDDAFVRKIVRIVNHGRVAVERSFIVAKERRVVSYNSDFILELNDFSFIGLILKWLNIVESCVDPGQRVTISIISNLALVIICIFKEK